MNVNAHLDRVIDAGNETSKLLKIPADMISLHSELRDAKLPDGGTLQGKRQHSLRWGAFLLVYAPLEGFFKEALNDSANTRTLPLNIGKIQNKFATVHNVKLFTKDWEVRTLIPTGSAENSSFCEWRTYQGTEKIRCYLSDMKSLRDRLGHGADPLTTTNESGALWPIRKGHSLRMLGVEGFLQAGCDLVNQTITAFGGTSDQFPDWPVPPRFERLPPMPSLGILQQSNR